MNFNLYLKFLISNSIANFRGSNNFTTIWYRPFSIPQLFRSTIFPLCGVSWLYCRVCNVLGLISTRMFTSPPYVCINLGLIAYGIYFRIGSFSWWLQFRSVWCLTEDDGIYSFSAFVAWFGFISGACRRLARG